MTRAESDEELFGAHLGLAKHAAAEIEWNLGQHRAMPRHESMLPLDLIAATKWARAASTNLREADRYHARLARRAGKGAR